MPDPKPGEPERICLFPQGLDLLLFRWQGGSPMLPIHDGRAELLRGPKPIQEI